MKKVSIGTSIFAGLLLVIVCLYQGKVLLRKPTAYVLGDDQLVDLAQDDQGDFYVIKCDGKEKNSKLPENLYLRQIDAPLYSGTNHIDATIAPEYGEAKAVLKEEREKRERRIQRIMSRQSSKNGSSRDPSCSPSRNPSRQSSAQARASAIIALEEADSEDSAESGDSRGTELGKHLAVGLPGYIPPEEPTKVNIEWTKAFHAVDAECHRKRVEELHNAATENTSHEQQEAIKRQAAIKQAVEDTKAERQEAKDAVLHAMAIGDGEALGEAVQKVKALLAKLEGAERPVTNKLNQLLTLGETRYEQYSEHKSKQKAHHDWVERVRVGESADWHMTERELWDHVEAGNLGAVRAGMRAKLPVHTRSKDGKRLTVLHAACRPACVEAMRCAIQAKEAAAAHSASASSTSQAARISPAAPTSSSSPLRSVAAPGADAAGGAMGGADAAGGGADAAGGGGGGPEAGAGGEAAPVAEREPQLTFNNGETALAPRPPDAGVLQVGVYERSPLVAAALGPRTAGEAASPDAGAGGPAVDEATVAAEVDHLLAAEGDAADEDPVTEAGGAEASVDEPRADSGHGGGEVVIVVGPSPEEIEAMRVDVETRRLGILQAILEAKANPSATDAADRTPLDLAVCEGGPGAEDLPIVQKMKALGLLNAREAAAQYIAQAEAEKATSPKGKVAHAGGKSKGPDPRRATPKRRL